ncbi:rCG57261 [Rattus norvegicus]|uniref:RCG57261 n=1 Tax=Rattus norvegicus TaxID=10116 RepID=A6KT14_RAT|nr:rCG57261 [Rattus norvegicus]
MTMAALIRTTSTWEWLTLSEFQVIVALSYHHGRKHGTKTVSRQAWYCKRS